MTTKPTGVWLQDQDLLYRLADTKHGVSNCDEIRVTQVDGSRTMERCIERAAELMAALRASHGQAPAGVTPEGWKLVPVKPTFAMIQAGLDKKNASVYVSRRVPRIYESMLNAAPSHPTAQAAPAAGAVAGPDVKYALAHADTAADLLMRAHEQAPETWRGWYDDALVHIDIARKALAAAPTPAAQADNQPAPTLDESTPGEWFVRKLVKDGELHGCFVAAPDYLGMPYDAEILGDDEYRDKPESDETSGMRRRLADCELIVAAVKHYRAARKQGGTQ